MLPTAIDRIEKCLVNKMPTKSGKFHTVERRISELRKVFVISWLINLKPHVLHCKWMRQSKQLKVIGHIPSW